MNEAITIDSNFIPNEIGKYNITGDYIYFDIITREKESFGDVASLSKPLEAVHLKINYAAMAFLMLLFINATNIHLKKAFNQKI